jgi:uncharacterized membrane protein
MSEMDIRHQDLAQESSQGATTHNYPGMGRSTRPQNRPQNVSRPQNISQTERWVSTIGGSTLLAAGLVRGKLCGLLMTLCGGALVYRGMTGHCHAYDALGIDTAEHPEATAVPAQTGVKVEKTIIVNRSAKDLYAFWRDVENLPSVMNHLEEVEANDATHSHWWAKGPMGKLVEWEAEIFNEREGEFIAWRSLPGSDIDTAGSVHFKSLGNDRGTAITVSLKYNPPAGKVGASIASLLGNGLEQQLDHDLRHFKSVLEAGESPRTAGQPRGS